MALKIGISGKRNIIDTDKDDLAAKIKSSIDEILKKHNSNEFIGYTSLAIGADTIFADIVTTEFKMPLVIILPFDEAEYTKDFTTTTDRDNLGKYLADNKHTIEIATTKSPANDDERSEAYFEAGKVIVKDCDEMIFVWDECKPNGKAGTAEVMGYFRETRPGKKEVVINVTAFKTDWLYNEIDAQYEQVNNLAMENRDHYKKIWTLSIGLGWTVVFIFALNTIFHLEPKIELPHWIYQVAAILELGFVVRVFLLIESAKKKQLSW